MGNKFNNNVYIDSINIIYSYRNNNSLLENENFVVEKNKFLLLKD